ncbi:hypothetical protein ABFX02_13G025900 [Erythranthe guttata]
MSSMALSTLHFKTPIKFIQNISSRIVHRINPSFQFTSSSLAPTINPSKEFRSTHNFYGPLNKSVNGFSAKSRGCVVKAQNGSDSAVNKTEKEDEEMAARGQSSMPERFRYLTKEAPDKSVRWPWLIVLAFMLYTWRTVLWELSNWRKSIFAIGRFLQYLSKFALAFLFHFIGNPLTSLIHAIETTLYTIRSFYSGVIAYAPISDLTLIIMLTSAVLAISEAAAPDSVNRQPYILTVAGLIGYCAVKNYITELFFWTLLVGLFGYSSLVKKRDYVSSALPVAVVLAAVGEPWVRVISMGSFLGLAIFHYSRKKIVDSKEGEENNGVVNRVPIPLVCAGLAIGVRVAAKWAGYRHLTWMIA